MEASPKSLKLFRSRSGSLPFSEWFLALPDRRAQQKIIARLARVRGGNLGRTNSVGEGVQELKIDYGPGYRVYFGQAGTDIVILLCGGDKQTQTCRLLIIRNGCSNSSRIWTSQRATSPRRLKRGKPLFSSPFVT